jgi:hypothetical protein
MMAPVKQATSQTPADEAARAQGEPRMPRLPLPGMPIGMPIAMPAGMPGRVLWWGGLAAVAALDIVDWPVAVLVGAGSWVAERYAKAAIAQQYARAKAPARQGAEQGQAS